MINSPTAPEPEWLRSWRLHAISCEAALSRFDSLAGLDPQEMIGVWRGSELRTGHPLDGLLESFGWYGKQFQSQDDVHPLLFVAASGRIVAVNPAFLPIAVPIRWQRLVRSTVVQRVFRRSLGLIAISHPTARLRRLEFRGTLSTAMIYDRQPIIDHYRRIDDDRALGLMDWRGSSQPFFFMVERRHVLPMV